MYWGILIFTLLICSNKVSGQTKLIKSGEVWLYYDKKQEPPSNWVTDNFEVEGWKSGYSPLGYGDSVVKAELDFGGDKLDKIVTVFFRKEFIIEDPYKFLIYILKLKRDDGAVVYLNGRELWRSNMPQGEVTATTFASALVVRGEVEKMFYTKLLLPSDFVTGKNIISISVHKANKSSVDCIFDLELIGSNEASMVGQLHKETAIRELKYEERLLERNYQQELKTRELEYELLQVSQRRLTTIIWGGGILFCLVLFTLLIVWFKTNRRTRNLRQSVLELEKKLCNRDTELMQGSIDSINNIRFLKELKARLKLLHNSGILLSNELEKLIVKIDVNLDDDESWNGLKKHFNAVHLGYYDKLLSLYPTLTEVELRHCIFIKLFLHTKEIAHFLNIDPKSVQASRYRIKKKMQLGEDIDLKEYLINI